MNFKEPSTFKCWLVANFEIALFWLTMIVGGIFFLIFANPKAEIFEKYAHILIFGSLFVWAFTTPTTSSAFQYGKYFVMVGAFILLWWGFKEGIKEAPPETFVEKMLGLVLTGGGWVFFAITSAISGWLAHFTYRNIDEVLSRRMLYRNSNVSLFEYTWKYVLDRFCNISFSIVTCTVWLAVIIIISLNKF